MTGWTPEQWTALIGTLGIPAFLLITLVYALYKLGKLCLPPIVSAFVRHIDRVTSSVETLETTMRQMGESGTEIASGVKNMLSVQSQQDVALSDLRQVIVAVEEKRVNSIEQIERAISRQADAAQKQSEAMSGIAVMVEKHLGDVRDQLSTFRQ